MNEQNNTNNSMLKLVLNGEIMGTRIISNDELKLMYDNPDVVILGLTLKNDLTVKEYLKLCSIKPMSAEECYTLCNLGLTHTGKTYFELVLDSLIEEIYLMS